MTDERRQSRRAKAYKGVKAVYGDFRFTQDCLLRNQSPDGAMIRSDHAAEIPREFFLFDPQVRSLQQVEVIWRTDRDVGVRFLGAPVDVQTSTDPRHRRFRFV